MRSLAGKQAGLSETALLAEAWSAEPEALPEGWSAAALRRSDVTLLRDPGAVRDEDPVIRHLQHLGGTLTELAETGVGLPVGAAAEAVS